jgi:drug/metabolite transporter (DMT)-like permease
MAVTASVLWASSLVLIKIGLEDLPPLTFASLRYVLGALVLIIYRTARRPGRRAPIEPVNWLLLVILGLVLYAAVPAVMFLGIDRVDVVTYNFVFQAGIPLLLALSAGMVLREGTSRWEWAGVAVVVAGTWVFFFGAAAPGAAGHTLRGQALGISLAALAALGIASSNLLQRRIMRPGTVTSLDAAMIPMGLGSITLLAVALTVESFPPLDAVSVLLLLTLGVVNTAFAFTIWHAAMRTLTALHAGIIASSQLVVGAVLAWLFLDDPLPPRRIIGSIVVLGGILAVHLSRASTRRKPVAEAATPHS